MKFQEIDRLAQSVDKLPDIANLGDRYVYHRLREVYDRYLAGKLEKEEAEAERKSSTRRTGSIGSRRQRT